MLKTYWRIITWIERFGDNLIIIMSFFLAHSFRDSIVGSLVRDLLPFPQDLLELGNIDSYLIILGISLPLYNASLSVMGGYKSMRRESVFKIVRILLISAVVVFLSIGAILFLLKLDLSRSFVGLFVVISTYLLILERVAVFSLLRYFRARGRNFRNIIIVGSGDQARKLYFEISRQAELGIRVIGFVDIHAEVRDDGQVFGNGASSIYDLGARIVSNAETFEASLKKYAIDEVIFTEVIEQFAVIRDLAEIAVDEGVRVTFAADVFSMGLISSEVGSFGEIPVIHYNPSPTGSDSLPFLFKRMIDFILSTALIVILSPLALFVAFLIKAGSPGPILFKQKRVGLNGRLFTLYKFRSMYKDAESQLSQLLDKNEMNGPVFKMKDDPRITPLGRFIRKYSIDELPQLFNVFRGDMSLVGPRPPLPEEVGHYKRKQRKRLSMRPGLTCIWQVSGRNNINDFDEWSKLDLEYIDTWSLGRDFILLAKTVPVVLFGSGAR